MTQTQTHTAEAGDVTTPREALSQAKIETVERIVSELISQGQFQDAVIIGDVTRAALAASPAPRAPAAVPEELRRLSEAATPGPWAAESEKSDGSYGSGEDTFEGYDTAVIVTEAETEMRHGKPGVLFESHNSTVGSIREESDDESFRAWDEVSEANADFIVALVNAFRAGTLAAAPAAPPADGGTEVLRVLARKIDEIIDRTTVARGAFENGEAIQEITALLEETFSVRFEE